MRHTTARMISTAPLLATAGIAPAAGNDLSVDDLVGSDGHRAVDVEAKHSIQRRNLVVRVGLEEIFEEVGHMFQALACR